MSDLPIYLDHNATTPLDPGVLKAMMPYLTDKFGNASSLDHSHGYDASVAVQSARDLIAKSIGARNDEIVFTSGATESDNLALRGVMERYADKGNHLVTCATEHEAVLDTARHLESVGKEVTYLPVDEFGLIDLGELERVITDKTVLVSIMAANNEVGTMPDLRRIGEITRQKGVLFHTDAAQTVGKIPMNVNDLKIDLMSFSAHKIYGPKGIGALYVRGVKPRVRVGKIVHGGGQERGLRSGTLNVPAIVGFGKAIDIAMHMMESDNKRLTEMAKSTLNLFEDNGALLNGHRTRRIAGNLNMCFPRIEGKAIINSVSESVSISAGSACTTQSVEPSHVIMALGHDEDRAHGSIRLGLGRHTNAEQAEFAAQKIIDAVRIITKAMV